MEVGWGGVVSLLLVLGESVVAGGKLQFCEENRSVEFVNGEMDPAQEPFRVRRYTHSLAGRRACGQGLQEGLGIGVDSTTMLECERDEANGVIQDLRILLQLSLEAVVRRG